MLVPPAELRSEREAHCCLIREHSPQNVDEPFRLAREPKVVARKIDRSGRDREEPGPCRGWTLGTVRIVNLVNGRKHLLAIGKQPDQCRFVRDEGAYLARMSSGECKSRYSAAAASEHAGWFCRDQGQQPVHVVGDQLRLAS